MPPQLAPLLQLFGPEHTTFVMGASLSTFHLHASVPAHCTLQLSPPQLMKLLQDLFPLHTMSQLLARVQSTLPPHEESPQVTRQGIPAGQVT